MEIEFGNLNNTLYEDITFFIQCELEHLSSLQTLHRLPLSLLNPSLPSQWTALQPKACC